MKSFSTGDSFLTDCLRLDKIVGFAPLWQSTSDNPDDEDWDEEQDDSSAVEEPECETRTYDLPKALLSATGKPLHPAAPTTITVQLGRMNISDLHRSGTGYFGSLSRFLCLALDELNQKHQLDQTETGAYMMKHEPRRVKSSAISHIRKVSITPSSIYYEGPQAEEYCAVTRRFIEFEDRFLRISFRDEGKREKSLLLQPSSNLTSRLLQIDECQWLDAGTVQAHQFHVESWCEHLWTAV